MQEPLSFNQHLWPRHPMSDQHETLPPVCAEACARNNQAWAFWPWNTIAMETDALHTHITQSCIPFNKTIEVGSFHKTITDAINLTSPFRQPIDKRSTSFTVWNKTQL